MLLTIDVGNTNSVLGVFRGRRVDRELAIDERRAKQTIDEYGVLTKKSVHTGGPRLGRDYRCSDQLGGAASEPDVCGDVANFILGRRRCSWKWA